MSWVEIFSVLLVCHLAGDFLLQTEWQALNKHGGLRSGNREQRNALLSHIATYAIPFLPAFAWISHQRDTPAAAFCAAIVLITHLVQDDGTLLKAYVRNVKHTTATPGTPLWMAIDQSCHVIFLFAAALAATI